MNVQPGKYRGYCSFVFHFLTLSLGCSLTCTIQLVNYHHNLIILSQNPIDPSTEKSVSNPMATQTHQPKLKVKSIGGTKNHTTEIHGVRELQISPLVCGRTRNHRLRSPNWLWMDFGLIYDGEVGSGYVRE